MGGRFGSLLGSKTVLIYRANLGTKVLRNSRKQPKKVTPAALQNVRGFSIKVQSRKKKHACFEKHVLPKYSFRKAVPKRDHKRASKNPKNDLIWLPQGAPKSILDMTILDQFRTKYHQNVFRLPCKNVALVSVWRTFGPWGPPGDAHWGHLV